MPNNIILIVRAERADLERIRKMTEWKFELSKIQVNASEVVGSRYVLLVDGGQAVGFFIVKEWKIPTSGESISAYFSAYLNEYPHIKHEEYIGSTKNHLNDEYWTEGLERLSKRSKNIKYTPESPQLMLDMDAGARAIAMYYGVSSQQVAISIHRMRSAGESAPHAEDAAKPSSTSYTLDNVS